MKMRKVFAALLAVLMLCSVIPFSAAAEGTSAVIDFTDKANRTAYSTEQQVWEQNGITVTNDKGASTSNVGDYGGDGYPARFYKSSTVKIEYPGMTKIVIDCSGLESKYVNGWADSAVGATATVDGSIVTIVLAAAADSFTWETMSAQSRANKITVYTGDAGDAPVVPDEPETPVEPSTDPEADTELTVAQVIALGLSKEHNVYTTGKYYVSGVITEVYNTQYGNMKITDDAGNILTIYGTYSADGSTRYDAMDVKPVAGDTVKIYGIIGQYNGTSQLKNGWIVEHIPGEGGDDPVVPPVEPDVPAAGVVTNPVAGVAYKFGLDQTQKGAIYYFTGAMSGYYGATDTDIAKAVDMYVEIVDGGYKLYFNDASGAKKYIKLEQSGTHYNFTFGAEGSVFTLDAEKNAFCAPCGDQICYMGTYGSYVTVGCLTSAKIADTDYIARLYAVGGESTECDHAYDSACDVDCNLCGDIREVNHTVKYVAAVAATCTENGNIEYWYCEICGAAWLDAAYTKNTNLKAVVLPISGEHTYDNDTDADCNVCGEKREVGGAVVGGGSADFDTIVLPANKLNGDSTYTATYTTANGWVTTYSAIQCGGSTVMNPQFPVIGADNTSKAVCMNGKTSAPGKITSPTLTGGISQLTLTYTKMFTDTKLSVTITVTDLSTGAVYTHTVAREEDKNTKYEVWTDEWVLDTPITGDFTIELVNDCPSNVASNKDRLTVLDLSWLGAASSEEPEIPACNHEYDNACDVDCNLCGEIREVTHTVKYVAAKAATCTELGNIEYWYCADCGYAWLDAECTLNTNLKAVVLPTIEHTYDSMYDASCNSCGAIREVQQLPYATGGSSVSEEVSGLANKFDLTIEGISIKNNTYNQADFTNATFGGHKLLGLGVIASNGTSSVDIPAVHMCALDGNTASFAFRVVNIPADKLDVEITMTPYFIIEIDGVATTVYGEPMVGSYNSVGL